MKASLFHLILYVTAILLTHIAKNLTEYPFQCVVTDLAARWSFRSLYRLVTIIADIERRAIKMAGLLCSIAITTTQLDHIFLRAKYAGNNQFMHGDTLNIKAVEESLTDILQENSSTRHEIWNAGIERINMEIGIRADINQFTLTGFSILTILNRRYAPLLGSNQLYSIGIRECFSITRNRSYFVEGGTSKVYGGICH